MGKGGCFEVLPNEFFSIQRRLTRGTNMEYTNDISLDFVNDSIFFTAGCFEQSLTKLQT